MEKIQAMRKVRKLLQFGARKMIKIILTGKGGDFDCREEL